MFLLFVACVCELHWALKYPYLNRSMQVNCSKELHVCTVVVPGVHCTADDACGVAPLCNQGQDAELIARNRVEQIPELIVLRFLRIFRSSWSKHKVSLRRRPSLPKVRALADRSFCRAPYSRPVSAPVERTPPSFVGYGYTSVK